MKIAESLASRRTHLLVRIELKKIEQLAFGAWLGDKPLAGGEGERSEVTSGLISASSCAA